MANSAGVDGVGSLAIHGLPRPAWAQLRNGTWKPLLVVDDASFYAGSTEHVSAAYTTAWLTCLYIADHYGEATLRQLYAAAAARPATESQASSETAVLRSVLHTDRKHLLVAVTTYAKGLRRHFV